MKPCGFRMVTRCKLCRRGGVGDPVRSWVRSWDFARSGNARLVERAPACVRQGGRKVNRKEQRGLERAASTSTSWSGTSPSSYCHEVASSAVAHVLRDVAESD